MATTATRRSQRSYEAQKIDAKWQERWAQDGLYTVNDDGDEFFNRTDPQVMNNQTLPPGFDVTQGFQLVTGQNIHVNGGTTVH